MKSIILRMLGEQINVPINKIIRVEADNNYTWFYLNDGNKIKYAHSLKYVETILTHAPFLRVHKSHLINKNYIQHYDYYNNPNSVLMNDGTQIPIAREKIDYFLEKLKHKIFFSERKLTVTSI